MLLTQRTNRRTSPKKLNNKIFLEEQTSAVPNFPNRFVSGIGVSKTNPVPKIYPNPTTGKLNIEFESEFEFKIIDALGKVILEGKSMSNSLDVSSLSSGVYRLVLYNDKEIFTTNLVKQ